MSKDNWRKGPADHIVCEPPHDRPIFCLAVSENKFVTGSADHGLREYNMYSCQDLGKMENMWDNFSIRNMDTKNG